ncbi:DUF484 family protein [Paraburkholderia kururiensis]|uniref:DUF484 family protein n=1 Tax=Paraburkholderia kururiensis TaxID=984307 RepID=UPI00034C8692|nr:DUF484 family protein [Paraburkholderia kururiensis]
MNDREVADYLLANPDFFTEHAELLATIRLGNPHGKAAVSLQERQMEMLRDKNKLLERRLAELLRYGHENDSIAAKFNRWTTRVISERDPYALPRTIADNLRDVFDVPQAALRVWDVAEQYAQADFARHTGEEVRIFANSLAAPYCGANTGFEAAQWLAASAASTAAAASGPASVTASPLTNAGSAHAEAAGNDAAVAASSGTGTSTGIESIAILALRDPQADAAAPAFGLLVMGSPDPRRFHEGMATDFLSQIGALASAALTRLLPR